MALRFHRALGPLKGKCCVEVVGSWYKSCWEGM